MIPRHVSLSRGALLRGLGACPPLSSCAATLLLGGDRRPITPVLFGVLLDDTSRWLFVQLGTRGLARPCVHLVFGVLLDVVSAVLFRERKGKGHDCKPERSKKQTQGSWLNEGAQQEDYQETITIVWESGGGYTHNQKGKETRRIAPSMFTLCEHFLLPLFFVGGVLPRAYRPLQPTMAGRREVKKQGHESGPGQEETRSRKNCETKIKTAHPLTLLVTKAHFLSWRPVALVAGRGLPCLLCAYLVCCGLLFVPWHILWHI